MHLISYLMPSVRREFPLAKNMDSAKEAALQGLRRYAYTSFTNHNSIRLLRLLPGVMDDDIRCSLDIVPLGEAQGRYEALSYCWGSGYITVECVDERDHSLGHVAITPNLHEALRHLRSATKARSIWADAICVNQDNLGERSLQVQLMRQVYAGTQRVILWLGGEDEHTPLGLVGLAEIGKHCQNLFLPSLKAMSNMGELANMLNVPVLPHLSDAIITATEQLFRRPWFARVWVIQEVCAGPDVIVQIGSETIPWNIVGIAAHWLREARWSSTATGEGSEQLRNAVLLWQQRFNSQASAPNLLDEGRDYGATDPRDKVYALLGFPAMQEHAQVVPDYQNKTVTGVYMDLAHRHIRNSRKLAMLSYAEHPPMTGILERDQVETWPGLPSWVPNWSEQTYFPTSSLVSILPYADNASHSQPEIGPLENDELLVQGWIVGQVATAATHLTWEHRDGMPAIANIGALVEFWGHMQAQPGAANLLDLKRSLSQAMTAGITAEYQSAEPSKERHEADFVQFLNTLLQSDAQTFDSRSRMSTLLAANGSGGDAGRYLQAAYLMMPSRRLFCGSDGVAGLGHSQVQRGDVVVVLLGSTVPFVLRPRGLKFQLVGECFLHGWMGSDAAAIAQQELKEFRSFKLV